MVVVDSLIKNAGGRYGLIEYQEGKKLGNAFDNLFYQAEIAIQKKNFLDALDICIAVLIKVPNFLLAVDDSSGALQESCYFASNILDSLLASSAVPPIFKDQAFDTILDVFEKDKSGFDFKKWPKEREIIISQVLGKDKTLNYKNIDPLAQIYINEKLWERLLALFQYGKITTHTILRYGVHLHKAYPVEMIALYKPIIIQQAKIANKRSDYRKIVGSLKNLLKIKGGRNTVEKLVQNFQAVYIRRPAMMDELKKVL